jgi:hypothetical protein
MRLHMPHLSQPYAGRHRPVDVGPLTDAEREEIHQRIADAIDERTHVLMDQATDRPYLDQLTPEQYAAAMEHAAGRGPACRCHETTGHSQILRGVQSFIPGMGGCPAHAGPHERPM